MLLLIFYLINSVKVSYHNYIYHLSLRCFLLELVNNNKTEYLRSYSQSLSSQILEKLPVIDLACEDNKNNQNLLESYIESRHNTNQINELFGEPPIPPNLSYLEMHDRDHKPKNDFESTDNNRDSPEKNNASTTSSKSLSSPNEQSIFLDKK